MISPGLIPARSSYGMAVEPIVRFVVPIRKATYINREHANAILFGQILTKRSLLRVW